MCDVFHLGSFGMKICGPAKLECVHQANIYIHKIGYPKECQCIPPCISLIYNAFASQSDFDVTRYSKSEYEKYDSVNRYSLIVLFFIRSIY